MKLIIPKTGAAQPARFTAPTVLGARGEVCPQAGFRRVDTTAPKHAQVSFPTAGASRAAMGDRPWSPLTT